MTNGFGLALLIIFSTITLIALLSALRVLFPRVVDRTQAAADLMPGRAFVIGLVNILFFGAMITGFSALSNRLGAGIFLLPALLILTGLVIGLGFGLTGIATILGERLYPEAGLRRQTAWGAVVLILSSLTPFVGWLGFFPYTCSIGLGGFILGWFQRSRTPPGV